MKEGIKRAVENYNKIAKIYSDYTQYKLLQYQLNKFISLLNGKKVLDVGCGSGRDSKYFKDFNLNVTSIDISDEMIKEAKKRNSINVIKMDMLNISFDKESFNGIWVMATLQDIEKKDAPIAIKNFYNALKKDGIIYIAVKEGKGEIIIKKKQYNGIERFYSLYTKKELESLLKKANFSIINSIVSEDQGTKWVELFAKKE